MSENIQEITKSLSNQIDIRKNKIITLLNNSGIDVDYFCLLLKSNLFEKNDSCKLEKLDYTSLFSAIYQCARDKLLPDGKEGSFALFRNKDSGLYTVTYIPMFRGMLRKVLEQNIFSKFEANVVYENDYFHCEYGDKNLLQHRPYILNKENEYSRGRKVGVYSKITFKESNDYIFNFLYEDEINAIRNASYSKNSDSSPWKTFPDEMWKKSAGKRLLKTALCFVPFNPYLFGIVNETPIIDLDSEKSVTKNINTSSKLDVLAEQIRSNDSSTTIDRHTPSSESQEVTKNAV